MKKICLLLLLSFFLMDANNLFSQNITELIKYRSLGPHRAGSWISAITVPESDNAAYDYTYYIGARHGGLWKTENNGVSFFPVSDSIGVMSIGAVAVSKSNPDIVWLGSGESYNARSSHAGDGIYKSTDGGRSWNNMGLEDSHHISTIIIHPENPDIVWVASMGHLFSPNSMRGVFMTTDGGETWTKTLFIDDNTGVIDMIIKPQNPDVLYAAAYEKYRYPWHFEAGGQHSGIYKSVDGGLHWKNLKNGLPEGNLGRIGLALCHTQPHIVYAVIENLNPKPGYTIDENVGMSHLRDNYFDQMIGGELYRSDDSGETWVKQNDTSTNLSSKAAYSFNKIMIASDNPDIVYITSDLMQYSEDGGKTWLDYYWPPKVLSSTIFGDHRCLWMDPDDGRHVMFGSDGGLYESFDRGKTFVHHTQIPLGGAYTVETDNAYPYNIYIGLQDHEVWKGPSNDWSGKIGPADWLITGMWDGMYTKVDPDNMRWLYTTTQFGGHLRVDQLLGERVSIEPKAPEGHDPYRYCWTPPLELSPFDSHIVYTGGQMLLKSPDQGNSWMEISPDLTSNNKEKINGKGHMMYCSITTISASSVENGLLWAGTDDGKVWMTRDHGKSWTEFTDDIANEGGDKDLWVSRVFASPHMAGKAFVCKSGYRNDDFYPYVFKTTDFGQSWELINNGLGQAPVSAIVEDPHKEDLLFLGSDKGLYVSFDDGKQWMKMNNNMPDALVKDIKIQKHQSDIVLATYGRGAYIADIWALENYNNEITNEVLFFFPVQNKPQRNYSQRAGWGNYEMTGDNYLLSPNEPNGFAVYYHLREDAVDTLWLEIYDSNATLIDKLSINNNKGFHLKYYNTTELEVGDYSIKLINGDAVKVQKATVMPSPVWPVGHGNWFKL